METIPKQNEGDVFSAEEKADMLEQAHVGASSIEEVLSNVNAISEERFNAKNTAAEEQRIAELKTEIQAPAEPVEEVVGADINTVLGQDAANRMASANQQEKYALTDRIRSEAQELVKEELPWYKRMMRKDASYMETGKQVYTKAGKQVALVIGPDQKEYIKLTEYRGGGGDPGHQSTKNYYIPLEKAQGFLS